MTHCLKIVGALLCAGAACVLAQEASPPTPDVVQLSQQLQQTRAELADSRRQIEELRQSMEDLRRQVQSGRTTEPAATPQSQPLLPRIRM
jgi:septal ring factor EnvC (AmiA/AmiB activator)